VTPTRVIYDRQSHHMPAQAKVKGVFCDPAKASENVPPPSHAKPRTSSTKTPKKAKKTKSEKKERTESSIHGSTSGKRSSALMQIYTMALTTVLSRSTVSRAARRQKRLKRSYGRFPAEKRSV
jgi:hypothetical protein